MKKAVMLMLAVASMGLVACNNDCSADKGTAPKGDNDKETLYSGILPSADAQGTVYTLKLEFDADNNYTDGDFTMVENTLAADTVAASGLKEATTSFTKGDFRKESKQVNGANVEYIRLTPDAKDALGAPSACSMYFLVNEDGSLTMVAEDLQKPLEPALYTLTVK